MAVWLLAWILGWLQNKQTTPIMKVARECFQHSLQEIIVFFIRKISQKDPPFVSFCPLSYLTKVPFWTSRFQHSHLWLVFVLTKGSWNILISEYDQLSIQPLVKLTTIIYGNIWCHLPSTLLSIQECNMSSIYCISHE
jgi:hypothetical protein